MFEIGLRAYDEISSIKQKLTPDSFNKAFEHFYKQKFVFSKIQSNQAKIDNYDAQTQLTDVESANRDNLVKEQERLNGLFTFYGSLVNSSIGKQTKTKDNKDNIGEDTSIPKDKEDFVEDSPKDTSKDTKKTEDLPSTQQEKEDQKDDLSKVEIPVQDPIVDSSKVDFKTEPKPLVTDEEGNEIDFEITITRSELKIIIKMIIYLFLLIPLLIQFHQPKLINNQKPNQLMNLMLVQKKFLSNQQMMTLVKLLH